MILYLKAILTGLVSGCVVVAYRSVLAHAENLREALQRFPAWPNPLTGVCVFFAVLILLALLVGFIVKKYPVIRGSGIQRVRIILLRKRTGAAAPEGLAACLKEIILKFAGGAIAFACGLSLGRSGPSIHLGALGGLSAASLGKHEKRRKKEEQYLLVAGGAAGLAATFNAPLAGALFALEELHKGFSKIMLGCILASSLAAEFVADYFFGQTTVFHITLEGFLPLRYYPVLAPLGLAAGIVGNVFSRSVLGSMNLHDRLFPPSRAVLKPVPAFLAAGALVFVLPEILGSGNGLVSGSLAGRWGLAALCGLLAAKLFFTALSYGSGAPGGIFFPLLVMGSVLGRLYGGGLVSFAGFESAYMANFIVLGMAALFTAVVRAPLTAVILVSEMTGSLSHLIPLIAVCAIAHATAQSLKTKPIYDEFLDRVVKKIAERHF
ncbi:MAG: ClC family H(+)/Cl(-) exchange transporter [Spirochaetales bacterium]|jgi:H+/Cl- antiporter ClcA|nr:ClC family H(+)/Cl(-) exchange transporter [Spirochaetales bacterium]